MRIIAGEFGGRQLAAPKAAGTRPMTEKVRGALFNILGPIERWQVLDAYAGSGALGIEALSRGAASVVGIEIGKGAAQAIGDNLLSLQLTDQYRVEHTSLENWLERAEQATKLQFDLIVADPPYAKLDAKILGRLVRFLASSGILAVAHSSRDEPLELAAAQLVNERTYGDTKLSFYRQM